MILVQKCNSQQIFSGMEQIVNVLGFTAIWSVSQLFNCAIVWKSPQATHKWVTVVCSHTSLFAIGSWQDLAPGPEYAHFCSGVNYKMGYWDVLHVHLQNNKILSNLNPKKCISPLAMYKLSCFFTTWEKENNSFQPWWLVWTVS